MFILEKQSPGFSLKCPKHGDFNFPEGLIKAAIELGLKSQFCPICGSKLIENSYSNQDYKCSKCGNPVNKAAWTFCMYCGEKG